jgi:hypothetical protein
MQVVEVLNPLAREFKSIETLRKELAELQQELEKAHNQVCYHTRKKGIRKPFNTRLRNTNTTTWNLT